MIVVGYPSIFPATQAKTVNCPWLQPDERRQLNVLGRKKSVDNPLEPYRVFQKFELSILEGIER